MENSKNEKTKKIKVLHVFGMLNYGGAETMIMNFYRNIDRNKIQFDFVVHHEEKGAYEDEIAQLGGKIYRLPSYKVYNHFSYMKAWKNFFKEHGNEYDVIHGHVDSTASIYLSIAKKYGISTISHSHSISNGKGIKAGIKKILQFRIKYIADYFLGCSHEANLWLFGEKVANDSSKCTVLNNAIDYKKFEFSNSFRNEIRNKYKIQEDEILIGHVGRLTYPKNHEFIIDVFCSLLKQEKHYKLMLCGDGELKNSLIHYAQEKEVLDKIIFVPANSEIYKYYSAFDIFVFPSRFEGLGIVAIEAQVSGLPVLLSNCIPQKVVISENTVFLNIDENAINDWCEKIKSITKNMNVEKRHVKVLKDFDIKSEMSKLETIYLNLAQNNLNK